MSRLAPLEPQPLAYDKPLCASLDGFTLHAATRAGTLDSAGREALLHYVLRPPVAQERVEQRPERPLATTRAFFTVDAEDPALFYSGETQIGMDSSGRLTYFAAIGPQEDSTGGNEDRATWQTLFTAAGLDLSESHPVSPAWLPDVPADRNLAWETSLGGQMTRVAGATYHGRVVFFRVFDPWARATRVAPPGGLSPTRLALTLFVTTALVILVICLLLARRNLTLGRGDRRGALRASAAYLAVLFGGCLLIPHYNSSATWVFVLFQVSLGLSVSNALQFGVVYVALEPYVRRTWPDVLISWSRLLAGGGRDALVGRDVLIGTLAGVGAAVIVALRTALPYWFPIAGVTASAAGADTFLTTVPRFLGNLCFQAPSIMNAVATLAFLFIATRLIGRRTIAVVLTWAFLVVLSLRGAPPLIDVPLAALFALVMLGCLLRFGLLASIVAWITYSVCRVPLTTDMSRWYAWRGLFVVAALFLVASYGFQIALAGRSAFGTAFED